MTGKTHGTVGLAMAVTAVALGANVEPLTFCLGAYPGAYAPDVDIKGSTANKYFPAGSSLWKHRGFTHTLIIPILLILISTEYDIFSLVLGFAFGWLTHLYADLWNKKGIPILAPLNPKKIHIATVKTMNVRSKDKRNNEEPIWLVIHLLVLGLITARALLGGF